MKNQLPFNFIWPEYRVSFSNQLGRNLLFRIVQLKEAGCVKLVIREFFAGNLKGFRQIFRRYLRVSNAGAFAWAGGCGCNHVFSAP